MLRIMVSVAKWSVLGPVLVVGGGCLFFLDQVLPRQVLVGVLIAPFAGLAYWSGKSLHPYVIAWCVLSLALCGLWECCEICSGRWLISLVWRRRQAPDE